MAQYAPGATRWPFPFPDANSPEIAFFDLETTVPMGRDEKHRIIDFGAIVVDPMTLVVKETVSQLIYSDAINKRSMRINGISATEASKYGTFDKYADMIFKILDGRVWGGHNIIEFDIGKLCYEFSLLGRPMPRCIGVIDTYAVFAGWQYDCGRTGNLKLDTLGRWFGLPQEAHRALLDAIESFRVLLAGSASACFSALVNPVPPDVDPSTHFGVRSDDCWQRETSPESVPAKEPEHNTPSVQYIPTTTVFPPTRIQSPVPITYTSAATPLQSSGRKYGEESYGVPQRSAGLSPRRSSVSSLVRAMRNAHISPYFGKSRTIPILSGATVTIGEMLAHPLIVTRDKLEEMKKTRCVDQPVPPQTPPDSFAGQTASKAVVAAALEWKIAGDAFATLRKDMAVAAVKYAIPQNVLGVGAHVGYSKNQGYFGTYVVDPSARDDVYVDGLNLIACEPQPTPRTFRFDRMLWAQLVIIII